MTRQPDDHPNRPRSGAARAEIRDLINDSSFGTSGARELRVRTSRSDIADVLARLGVQARPDTSGRELIGASSELGTVPSPRAAAREAATVGAVQLRTSLSWRDPQAEPSDLIRSVSRAFQVLEAVGQSPRGLTVKQIARRCDLTVATTYHLVRTLAYEGYVMRREDGTYIVGLEVADRFRELVVACRGPQEVQDILRRAATDTGFTHLLGRFINGRVAILAAAEGSRSPHTDELITGFDEGAHATALGKALLATLTADQLQRFAKEQGMPAYTPQTLTSPEALEADLIAGNRRGLHIEINQFRTGLAGAAVLVVDHREPERRLAIACTLPTAELMPSAKMIRDGLTRVAHELATILREQP